MKWERVCEIGRELPEVVEDIWFRTPALKVRGKGICRLREEGDVVVFVTPSVEEQEFLISSQPEVYFITDHYRGWPAVLARLPALSVAECRLRLQCAFQIKAPKALLKQVESALGEEPPAPRTKAKGTQKRTERRKQETS